jgi:signal transduction histidine kinase
MEKPGRILIIDDELGIREGCRRILEPRGFSVQLAKTIQEGKEKIQAGNFDVVLLDIMMPDGRGIDLIAPIREKDPETIAVVITGYATVELAVNAMKQGAYNFISKPFSSDQLILTIQQGLERRHFSLETKRLQKIERETQELARAKAEMERMDQFKSKFTLMVAHELRSPLSGAQSLVRTLKRGLAGELNPRQAEVLANIESRLDLLMELVNDLLSLAASKMIAEEYPLEAVLLQELVQRVVERLSVNAESKGVTLVAAAPADPILIRATEDGVDKILTNLIGNAIKYTPEGGCVRIQFTGGPEMARIVIADTGIGIPAEALEHIWEDFYRAPNVYKARIQGTGLGLSIVKQFVDQYGGTIAVESEEGQGTTFVVRIPCLSSSEA